MANEFTSKVVLSNGETLIDLTQDDVKAEHVQNGIYFHDKAGRRQTGTNTKTVDASTATAEAAEVLEGRTFGRGNEMQTGTMTDNSGKNVEISTIDGAPIPRGYSDGASMAKLADAEIAKIVAGNIKEGVTILGVSGSFGADDISAQAKEVTPSFVEQIIQPTDGYDFLSQVTVKPIPVTRTDNEAGGVTVTIG